MNKVTVNSTDLQVFSPEAQLVLIDELSNADFSGVLGAEVVAELVFIEAEPLGVNALMTKLLPFASQYAMPPISEFYVGAICQGQSGSLYFGANLEIADEGLAFTVHAEQSAVNNALLHDEKGIVRVAVTAAPCGHCRQFLNELDAASELEVIVLNQGSYLMSSLLPEPFGPSDLGVDVPFFSEQCAEQECDLATLEHSHRIGAHGLVRSYAPYSHSPSSIVLKSEGRSYLGVYIENAAFNPSLPPILSALDRLRFDRIEFDKIQEVVLFEKENAKISQFLYTQAVLQSFSSSVNLNVVHVD